MRSIKPSPAKPASDPAKPAASPVSPGAKTVDTRSEAEKALVKKILVQVDKKIAQAQKESLAYEDNPATSALRETKKLINEISSAKELKEMLANAEYLTKEDADKLNDEEMALIRDQIVRDIDEVLFVKNSTAKRAPKKTPTTGSNPDAGKDAERLQKRKDALKAAENEIDKKLAEKMADASFTFRDAEAYIKFIKQTPKTAAGAIGSNLLDGGYINKDQRSSLIGADFIALQQRLIDGAQKIAESKIENANLDIDHALSAAYDALEARKQARLSDESFTEADAQTLIDDIEAINPRSIKEIRTKLVAAGYLTEKQAQVLLPKSLRLLRFELLENTKEILDYKKEQNKIKATLNKPPVTPNYTNTYNTRSTASARQR